MLTRGLRTITRRNFGYFRERNIPNYLSPELFTKEEAENYHYNWKMDQMKYLIKHPDEQKWLNQRDIDILDYLKDNLQSSLQHISTQI